ncbi:hypothetical protein ACH4Q7_26860 [Streptomyces roseolus]|uniref:hypothetical protein n=1 Tax=Streptomyces roseolus TaxID=67358 RepID=UPI00378A4CD8
MTTTQTPRPFIPSPAPPEAHIYHLSLHSSGHVLALFTGSRADRAVAAHAADLAARTGHRVIAAAVVRSTGFSINALLHHAHSRRIQAETHAILTPVMPAIARAGPVQATALVVPARINPYRDLPADRIERLAERTGTEVAVSPVPLTGYTSPLTRHLQRTAPDPLTTPDAPRRGRCGTRQSDAPQPRRS